MSKGTPFFLLEQTPFSAGQSLPGAKLYFYQTGTTTAQSVYTTPDLTVAHSNPVVADANGFFADIYLDPDASAEYRVRLDTSADVQVWQIDDVPRYSENFETDTYTVSWTGFSSAPAQTTASYYRFGRMVQLILPLGTGTSNSTGFGAANMPNAIQPSTKQFAYLPFGQDNSAHTDLVAEINTNGTITFSPAGATYDEAGWTASGSKGILIAGEIWYRLDDS